MPKPNLTLDIEGDPSMIRRSSLAGPSGEPLIVVEESGGIAEEEEEDEETEKYLQTSAPDSPLLNPYLLSPYRDMRKRSLPTPQCTSGITASQVRRLSEQGGEGGKGPSPMEAAFLATLSSAPAPSPGGRRHSVVTISRVPPTSLFGRNRRESIAAFGSGLPPRFPRKDSTPSMSGSNFNLQLDIMDDIAEIKAARKVKLKMWQTENEEKVCEVSEGGSVARYHQKENRRFSDVTGILPPKEPNKRRASEVPPTSGQPKQSGIVCTNTDLITMMSSLTSSAQEINSPQTPPPKEEPEPPPAPVTPTPPKPPPTAIDEKRHLLKSNRSNSFDVSLLPEGKSGDPSQKGAPGNWFLRRHVPMASKKAPEKSETQPAPKGKSLLDRKSGSLKTSAEQEKEKRKDKVLWDKPSGSVVDPQIIGSAIEVFLTKRTGDTPTQSTENLKKPQKASWFSGEPKETDEEVSCDNSICSTLKDLFVK